MWIKDIMWTAINITVLAINSFTGWYFIMYDKECVAQHFFMWTLQKVTHGILVFTAGAIELPELIL